MTVPIIPGSSEPTTLAPDVPESASPRGRRWLVPLVIALAVLLTGALAAVFVLVTKDKPAVEAAPTATTPLTPSPTGKVATIGQYAGIVNKSIVDIRESWSYYERICLEVEPRSVACSLRLLSFDPEAQILILSLTGAAKPGVPAYIGAPPAEIERLVADTLAAAQGVLNALPEDKAHGDDLPVFFAMSRLLDAFDRWQPYL
jgi:uncharacterized membrane protein